MKFQIVPFENTPENAREILANLGTNIDVIGFKDFENRDYTISEDSRIYHDIPGFKYCDVKNVGAIR